MKNWTCDKCGTTISEYTTYHPYSESRGKTVDLCLSCLNAYNKHMKKADAEFFAVPKHKKGKK